MMDPLFDKGWIKFNEEKWGVKSKVIEFDENNKWYLKAVLYFNKKNQIVNPPRNPHLPVYFECTAQNLPKVNGRKREAFDKLAEMFKEHGVYGSVNLSQNVTDLRPFIWKKFMVEPRYTYHIEIDKFQDNVTKSLINKANKAEKMGYYVEESYDYEDVISCLEAVEERKDFTHQTTKEDFQNLEKYVGKDKFVCFVAKDKDGVAKGARVLLYDRNDGMVIAWSAGIKRDALRDGVNNLLGTYAMDYFEKKGCKIFDFAGANIPSIANMKEAWGGDLTTYYNIRERSFKNLLNEIYFHSKHILNI